MRSRHIFTTQAQNFGWEFARYYVIGELSIQSVWKMKKGVLDQLLSELRGNTINRGGTKNIFSEILCQDSYY